MENIDKQSDPITTNQVIVIVETAKEQVKLKNKNKKAYNVKAATAFGAVQIGCGFITYGAGIDFIVNFSYGGLAFGFGFFGICVSFLFLLSGGLTISGSRIGGKCLVVASMVTDIISAIAGGFLLIVSAIGFHVKLSWQREYENQTSATRTTTTRVTHITIATGTTT